MGGRSHWELPSRRISAGAKNRDTERMRAGRQQWRLQTRREEGEEVTGGCTEEKNHRERQKRPKKELASRMIRRVLAQPGTWGLYQVVRNEKLGTEERSALENQDQGIREGARQLPSDGLSVWSRAQQAARSFADKQCYLGRTECSQGVEEASRRMNREKGAKAWGLVEGGPSERPMMLLCPRPVFSLRLPATSPKPPRSPCSFFISLNLATFHSVVHSFPSRYFSLLPSAHPLSELVLCSDCGFCSCPPHPRQTRSLPSGSLHSCISAGLMAPPGNPVCAPATTVIPVCLDFRSFRLLFSRLLSHLFTACTHTAVSLHTEASSPSFSSNVYFHGWEQLRPLKPKTTGIILNSTLLFGSQLQMLRRSSCLAHGGSLLSTATQTRLEQARLENKDNFLDGLSASSLPSPNLSHTLRPDFPSWNTHGLCCSPRDTDTGDLRASQGWQCFQLHLSPPHPCSRSSTALSHCHQTPGSSIALYTHPVDGPLSLPPVQVMVSIHQGLVPTSPPLEGIPWLSTQLLCFCPVI